MFAFISSCAPYHEDLTQPLPCPLTALQDVGQHNADGFGRNWVLIKLWLGQTQTVVFMEGWVVFSFLRGHCKTCYIFDPVCPFWWGWRRRKRCLVFSKGSQMVSSTGQEWRDEKHKAELLWNQSLLQRIEPFFLLQTHIFWSFLFSWRIASQLIYQPSCLIALLLFVCVWCREVSSPEAVIGRIFMVGLH